MSFYSSASMLRNCAPHTEVKDCYGKVWTKCLGYSDLWTNPDASDYRSSKALWEDGVSPIVPSATPVYVPPVKDEKTFYTDPATGARKEVKLAQLASIDPSSLWVLAEVAGYGAQKYEQDEPGQTTYNYLKGYPWSLNYNSVMRHLMLFWGGENSDKESGLPHLAHAAWQCLAMLSFMNHELGTDDRWVPPGREDV